MGSPEASKRAGHWDGAGSLSGSSAASNMQICGGMSVALQIKAPVLWRKTFFLVCTYINSPSWAYQVTEWGKQRVKRFAVKKKAKITLQEWQRTGLGITTGVCTCTEESWDIPQKDAKGNVKVGARHKTDFWRGERSCTWEKPQSTNRDGFLRQPAGHYRMTLLLTANEQTHQVSNGSGGHDSYCSD